MKQSIILWIAAFVVTFLAGFLQNRLSSEYPISGSFGIEGKEIGYKLDKAYYGNDDYKFFLRSEQMGIKGTLSWKTIDSEEWSSSELADSADIISGMIPNHKPLTGILYYIRLNYQSKSYIIPPNNKPVKLTYYGRIPASVNFYYIFTLFGALLLAVRTGLEYFRYPDKIKKMNIFTLIFVVVNVFVFHPLWLTYKMGTVGKPDILPEQMFPLSSVLLLIIWIAATVLIFNTKNYRVWAPAAAVITLFIFVAGKF